ncbi:MAG TPA: hypothetical protein VJU84_16605 [Pyrinomonadaceae bacterium]|nr:hypothetical protein [Pyrinomonadaceae bacterium]
MSDISFATLLQLDVEPRSLLLCSEEGEPVWPASGSTSVAIQQTARLFSASTVLTAGIPCQIDWEGPEEVVALGQGFVISEALLYAHLTRRKFRSVESLSDLVRGPRPDVLITRSEHVTHQLLDFLYPSDSDQPAPGMLVSDEQVSMRLQVLSRSAASYLKGGLSCRRVSFVPPADFDTQSVTDHELLGGRASGEAVLAALNREAGVLSVSTHSDGIDAFITSQLTLCPLDQIPKSADPNRKPTCCITGFCHRSDLPVAEAIQNERLLGVNAISARVLIWNVCNGVIVGSGNLGKVIDGNWGLMPRMLDSPRIGGILTTWYQTLSAPLQIETLSAAIASGVPVGLALNEFHRSPQSRISGIRFCLLGDPRMTLPSPSLQRSGDNVRNDLPVQAPRRRQNNGASVIDGILADTVFLRLWLTGVGRKPHADKARESAERGLEAISAYADALRLSPAQEASVQCAGAAMRELVISHLAAFGSLASRTWLRNAERPTLEQPSPKCFACGLSTNTYVAHAKSDVFRPRRLSICPGCGIIEDVPVNSTAKMRLDGELVRLDGVHVSGPWTCKLVAESMGPRNHKHWTWPEQDNGKPVESFSLPGPFPPGPIRVVVIFMSDAELFILQQPWRDKSSG